VCQEKQIGSKTWGFQPPLRVRNEDDLLVLSRTKRRRY